MSKLRIWILVSIIVVVAIALIWISRRPAHPERALVVCSFGGTFQESQRKAFFEPFSRETGVTIKEASYSGEYSKIKAMVEARNVVWDVVDVEDPVLLTGARKGLYEAIDFGVVDKNQLIEGVTHQYGVGADIYSTVLAFNTTVYSDNSRQPKTWQDFWDVKRFPGPRALRNNPRGTLEFALIADGVPTDELYPLDVQRAFRKLTEIKPHIKVWWTTGQQHVQLLANKEVVISSAWSGRIWNAKHINNLPLSMSWNGGLLEPEWWIIPRGAKNRDLAMKFIAFATRGNPQAKMAKLFGVGPTNKEAFQFLSNDLAKELPTAAENLEKQVRINSEWWAKNESKVQELWDEWLLQK